MGDLTIIAIWLFCTVIFSVAVILAVPWLALWVERYFNWCIKRQQRRK